MRTRQAVNIREFAAYPNGAFRRNQNRHDRAVGTGSRIESGIDAPIRVEAGDVFETRAVNSGKESADKNLTILLHSQVKNLGEAGDGRRIERIVEGTIRVQAYDADCLRAGTEIIRTADEEFAVSLRDATIGNCVERDCRNETGVEASV